MEEQSPSQINKGGLLHNDSSIMIDEMENDGVLDTVVDQEMTDEESKKTAKSELNDVISQNFKGRIRQIISFNGADGQMKVKENVIDSFAAILVRVVGFKEIYEAWENQYQSIIEDFRENDVILGATSSSLGNQGTTQAK